MLTMLVYWIRGYPDPPAPGPLQRPIFFVKEQKTTSSPIKKTLVRRRLTRKTTLNVEDTKRSSSDIPHEEEDQDNSSLCTHVLWGKDKTRKEARMAASRPRRPCCLDREATAPDMPA
jgi:hypothetical protein